MSDIHDPVPPGSSRPNGGEEPPFVLPVRYPPPPPPGYGRPRGSFLGAFFRFVTVVILALSIGLNIFLLLAVAGMSLGGGSASALHERYHSGSQMATNKVAIIHVDGVILEGLTAYAQKQIEEAAKDPNVKAVVLRINSPGGSITASDDLHRRIRELRDGTAPGQNGGQKPVVVSMGALAASGGYYIAVPAQKVMAERTTITGSIGVYAAFPNIAELAEKYGIQMNVIKAGDIKDSGSMFHKMSPQERELWQEMVNHAYDQFLAVVEEGRPKLKGMLKTPIIKKPIPVLDEKGNPVKLPDGDDKTVEYVRKRADGGIFTADLALKYGLIDQIGYLDDAVQEAAKQGSLGSDYKTVTYERPLTLMNLFMGAEASVPEAKFDPSRLTAGAMPRLWYLAPQAELAGLLAAVSR